MVFKKGQTAWNKDIPHKEETKQKVSKMFKGQHHSPKTEFKKGQASWNKGKSYKNGDYKIDAEKLKLRANNFKNATDKPSNVAYQRALEQCEILKEQGFRVIPIGRVIPDIIAIKDNKVYAVEIEYNTPNYDKYNKVPGLFDDIIWILKKRTKNGKL